MHIYINTLEKSRTARSVAGHNHRQVIARDPICATSTTWALTCPETVRQRTRTTREIETWLSYCRVGNNSVADYGSWRPVLCPLRNCVDRYMSDRIYVVLPHTMVK